MYFFGYIPQKNRVLSKKDCTWTELHYKTKSLYVAVYIFMCTKQYPFALFRNPEQWTKFENLAMQLQVTYYLMQSFYHLATKW